MKFKFIDMNKSDNRILKMCEMPKVSPQWYYRWKNRGKSNRGQANEFLLLKIQEIHIKSRRNYGSPRITRVLNNESIPCSQPRVGRIMRDNGIVSKTKRKFKATTNSKHKLPVAPNLVNQYFAVEGPNRLWVGDITYIDTNEGWLYFAKVMDVYNREIIGWATDKTMKKELVIKAMDRALLKRNPSNGVIFHSD